MNRSPNRTTKQVIPIKSDSPCREILIEAFNNDNYDKFEESLYSSKHGDGIFNIFMYCLDNNDDELLEKLINKHKNHKIINNYDALRNKLVNCNNKIIDIVFNLDIGTNIFVQLANSAICYNNMYLLNKLENFGYILTVNNLATALYMGENDYFESIRHLCDDIQKLFDDYRQMFHFQALPIGKIKYMLDIGINFSKHVDSMIFIYVNRNYEKEAMFLYELGATNTNVLITLAYIRNNINLITYFFEKGGVIDFNKNVSFELKYETIKFLLDIGYKIDDNTKKSIFIQVLKFGQGKDIGCIYDLFDNFDLDFIFESERKNIYKQTFYGNSIFEYIIYTNKIENMKFVIKNDNGKLDINKLFVVACCNGRIEIAKLLLDVNNNVDYNLAIECACYFGHYDTLNFLCQYDITLSDASLWMCIYNINCDDDGYKKILNKCNIVNDTYNCNEGCIDTLKLLLQMNVKITYEMFDNLRNGCYFIEMIYNMVDNGIDPNKILAKIVMIKYHDKVPDLLIEIVKYLLNNGANPNIDNVFDNDVKELLNSYL